MAALDLLGRRWALRILWELRDDPSGARELRQRCDAMSPSVMYKRLTELTAAGLVVQEDDARYRLSALGQALREAIEPLDHWARTWAEQSTASTP